MGALFLIHLRDPIQHGTSLHRQPLNFPENHRCDPFAMHYMEGIGHGGFGDHLRPIDFDRCRNSSRPRDPREIGFWLECWHAAHPLPLEETTASTASLSSVRRAFTSC